MSNILSQIVERKRERVEEAKRAKPIVPTTYRRPGKFIAALRRNPISIIAEIKRRSPSKGVIREHFEPATIARNYEANGAAAISVLTEEDFFEGSLDHLKQVRAATNVPLLRKDFIFDEYQILEAAEAGADAILLIAAMLEHNDMARLLKVAERAGLDVLVEVHDRDELEKTLRQNVKLLGVNNRDLRTFITDISTSIALARDLPSGLTLVSESGIRSRDEISRLREAGFHAVLIGEELMRADDEGAALRDLIPALVEP
jgi:indole-3-glycerol phosphate synthase